MSKLTLSFKGRVLKIIPVLQGEMVVGRDPSCTIHIDSLALAPRHAVFITQGTRTVLRDLSGEEGTFVNNERIREHTLKDGDLIRVGKHTLSYQYDEVIEHAAPARAPAPAAVAEPDPEPAPPAPAGRDGLRPAWLQILNGQNLGKTLSLNRSITNLGKPGVATAVIARRDDGYFLSHLEGKVSPRVGDEEIGDRTHKLEDGDIIQIGNVRMQFYYE